MLLHTLPVVSAQAQPPPPDYTLICEHTNTNIEVDPNTPNPPEGSAECTVQNHESYAWTADSIPDVQETWVQFKSRVKEAQDEIKSMADEGNKILAIGSGGSISTFVGMVLEIPDENVFDLNLQYKNTKQTKM